MRKITVTILSLLGCSACILSSAAILRAQNRQANAEQISQSGQNQTTSSSLPTQLLSPQSYEEYLHLDAPTDVAVTGNYTAIADGEQVFLYDREENEYFSYAHTTKVTKLQFDLSETLYFLDEDMRLYTLDPQTVETADASAVKTELSCTTFLIQENDFYYTVESGGQAKISKTTLSALGISSDTLVEGITPGPTVAYYNGELYYSSGRELWKYNPAYDNVEYVATCPHLSKISAMTIHSGTILICSEAEKSVAQAKNLFAYSLAELDEKANSIDATLLPTDEEGGYCSLSVHGEYVYAVKNNAVRQYDVTTNNFTSYEICDRSDSVHRLNDGTESCLIGDLLLIADNGNDRISVYNVTARTYQTPIESTLDCQYLASDGKTVLSASDSVAILYSLQEENYGQKLATFNGFDAALTGAVGVYGKYYFVTSDHRYVAENTENGWTLSAPHRANISATLLTADAYGYLYVAGGGNVYKYTEEQFFIDAQREKVCEEFPTGAEKMLVDYAGNLYALKDGALEKIGGEGYPLNTPLVYTDTAKLRSFAFGIEENVTYLLYDEDYLATTTLLDLPTVQKIAVENADERIFAKESAVFAVVETKPNTLVVRFDIEKLSGAELFPYLSYERRSEPFIALKIGESAQYNVLAVYDETQEEYFTCLALADFCDSADAYCTNYETAQTGYLTNDVSLYKFPYLTDLLTVTKTAGGKKITLLGEVEKLDYKYYHAQYETEDGQTVTGYIPVNYVTSFDGAPPKVETVVTENQTDGMDMLWRCCYLVLGFSVIAILTDVLILRKRKKDD
jgi:hypothetical protein